jgi:hypothetical protein
MPLPRRHPAPARPVAERRCGIQRETRRRRGRRGAGSRLAFALRAHWAGMTSGERSCANLSTVAGVRVSCGHPAPITRGLRVRAGHLRRSGSDERARDISESVPCLLPAISVRWLSPGPDDRGLAAGSPFVERGAAGAASPSLTGHGPCRSAPRGWGTRDRRNASGPTDREDGRAAGPRHADVIEWARMRSRRTSGGAPGSLPAQG